MGRLVPSIITSGFEVENNDVVDLSFKSDRFLPAKSFGVENILLWTYLSIVIGFCLLNH